MRVPRRTQDDIAVVNRDGTNWRDLTDDKYFDRYPRWSPDGARLLYRKEGTHNLIIDLGKTWDAQTPEQIRSVAVSRDGRLLYYTLLSTESDVWLLNLE